MISKKSDGKMVVAAYIRWSTDDQAEGTTCEVQKEACKHFILSQGWKYDPNLIFIDDGYSGGSLNRPSMTKLRKMIADKKIDCVVVYRLDRLSRSLLDTVNLVMKEWKNKCHLKSAREPIDTTTQFGLQILYILSSFAEWERATIRERTFSGKVKNAQNGLNPGFRAPYGYKNIKNKRGYFEVVESEAEIVKEVFNRYIKYEGMLAIANDLNSRGVFFKNKMNWSTPAVSRLLRNEIYIGRINFGKVSVHPERDNRDKSEPLLTKNETFISVKSEHIEPIVSDEVFEEAKRIREGKNEKGVSGRSMAGEYLLTSLIFCKKCGHAHIGKMSRRENYNYYSCKGKTMIGKSYCDATNINTDYVDKIVEERVKKIFLSDEGMNELKNKIYENYESKKKALLSEITKLESTAKNYDVQVGRIKGDYRNDKISAEVFNELSSQINDDRNEVNAILSKLSVEYDELKNKSVSEEEIQNASSTISQWEILTKKQKKMILREWIKRIDVWYCDGNLEVDIAYRWDSTAALRNNPKAANIPA